MYTSSLWMASKVGKVSSEIAAGSHKPLIVQPILSQIKKAAPKITKSLQDLPCVESVLTGNKTALRPVFLTPKSTAVKQKKIGKIQTKIKDVSKNIVQVINDLPSKTPAQSPELISIKDELTQFDRFVTVGAPPSQNPSLYDRKVAKFVLDSRLRYPEALLLTCVGSFYEAYFDQAIEVANLLNIKRAKYTFAGHEYPFSGFPTLSLDRHLKTLVNQHNRTVAIAEQITHDQGILERRIVRIITPGTVIDEDLIETDGHNFLLAIEGKDLAWVDVSTGTHLQTNCENGVHELMDHISRIAPKEVIIPHNSPFSIPKDTKAAKLSTVITKIEVPTEFVHSSGSSAAERLLSYYIQRNLLPSQLSNSPTQFDLSRHLKLDSEAIDGLELLTSQNGKSTSGSLLSTVSRTFTKPGKRLLKDRLSKLSDSIDSHKVTQHAQKPFTPITVLPILQKRLDRVQSLVDERLVREDIQDRLKFLTELDYIRLLQRFHSGSMDFPDLVALHKVLDTINSIQQSVNPHHILTGLGSHESLALEISKALNLSEGADRTLLDSNSEDITVEEEKDLFMPVRWKVCSNHSNRLINLHRKLNSQLESGRQLQNDYRLKLQNKDLKLLSSPKLGAILKFNRPRGRNDDWRAVLTDLKGQKLLEKNTLVIAVTEKWTSLCSQIGLIQSNIKQVEDEIIQGLVKKVVESHSKLKDSFEYLAELDVSQSFATFAVETGCVRPTLSTEKSTIIRDGRNPIAEEALISAADSTFQPNSIIMKESDGLCQIITGPNNGGKTTFLRQIAISHILAQAGSFVPAQQAQLGLVTQIFTRFGSYDNTILGKGTFMIEMEETAKILKNATSKSLVIMDEVGRGTGNTDGLSIAYAVVKYLMDRVNCRTLFATHLHQLVPLLTEDKSHMKIDKLGFFCIGCSATGNGDSELVHFRHKVVRGVNSESRGIDVAQMAGLPPDVIKSARSTQKILVPHLTLSNLKINLSDKAKVSMVGMKKA